MDCRITRRHWISVTLAGTAGLLASCAPAASPTPASAPPPAAAPTKAAQPAPATAPAAAPKPASPTQPTAAPAPTKPAQKTKVKMVQVFHGLSFAPVYVSQQKGFFADEGIDLEFDIVQGGAPASAALSSGEVQFSSAASTDLITSVERDLPMVGILGIATSSVFQMLVAKTFAQAKGVTPSSPLQQRLDALKGGRYGTASLGGAPDRFTRWLMVKGGYTLNDVEVLRIGGGPELFAAIREGQIDGFLLSPPWGPQAEKEGFGVVLLNLGTDVPEFKDFVQQVLVTSKDYIAKSPDVIERVCRALVRGNAFMADNPQESTVVLQKVFDTTAPDVIASSMQAIRQAFPKDGRMTELQWANTVKILREAAALSKAIDIKEGTWWTNQFIKSATR